MFYISTTVWVLRIPNARQNLLLVFFTPFSKILKQIDNLCFWGLFSKAVNTKTGENIFSELYFKLLKIWSVKHPKNGRNTQQPQFFCHKLGV